MDMTVYYDDGAEQGLCLKLLLLLLQAFTSSAAMTVPRVFSDGITLDDPILLLIKRSIYGLRCCDTA